MPDPSTTNPLTMEHYQVSLLVTVTMTSIPLERTVLRSQFGDAVLPQPIPTACAFHWLAT
jgi:hypothetical protein